MSVCFFLPKRPSQARGRSESDLRHLDPRIRQFPVTASSGSALDLSQFDWLCAAPCPAQPNQLRPRDATPSLVKVARSLQWRAEGICAFPSSQVRRRITGIPSLCIPRRPDPRIHGPARVSKALVRGSLAEISRSITSAQVKKLKSKNQDAPSRICDIRSVGVVE